MLSNDSPAAVRPGPFRFIFFYFIMLYNLQRAFIGLRPDLDARKAALAGFRFIAKTPAREIST
jgi:hypothetical protein